MKNIIDSADRAEILQRINRLTPASKPEWGKMNVDQMLCHSADQLRIALHEKPAAYQGNLLTTTLMKWMVLRMTKMPKNVKTFKALDQLDGEGTPPQTFEKDKTALVDVVKRFCAAPESFQVAVSPIFGKLSKKQWGQLAYIHLNHHLLQFGV